MRLKATSRSRTAVLGIVAILIGIAIWWWPAAPRRETVGKSPLVRGTVVGQSEKQALQQRIRAAVETLQKEGSGETVGPLLAELRQSLAGLPKEAAAAAIQTYLDSGEDARSGLSFKIGASGFLVESPTLRVFLLDLLGQIDPAAAATYAKLILSRMDAPDEWAVALRICALGDASPEGRAFLQEKMNQLLRNEAWQQNPSVGFLESFDVAVHLGGTDLLSPLTDLLRNKDNPTVAHAAFLALDRMVIQQPAEVLAALDGQSTWMQGREATRANYFARADVGDPAQRQVVENYLLNSSRQPDELNAFAGVFPNANYMISHNLLTRPVTPDGATLARRDRDALRVVEEWLADPRFQAIQPQLRAMQKRLQSFVQSAEGSR